MERTAGSKIAKLLPELEVVAHGRRPLVTMTGDRPNKVPNGPLPPMSS